MTQQETAATELVNNTPGRKSKASGKKNGAAKAAAKATADAAGAVTAEKNDAAGKQEDSAPSMDATAAGTESPGPKETAEPANGSGAAAGNLTVAVVEPSVAGDGTAAAAPEGSSGVSSPPETTAVTLPSSEPERAAGNENGEAADTAAAAPAAEVAKAVRETNPGEEEAKPGKEVPQPDKGEPKCAEEPKASVEEAKPTEEEFKASEEVAGQQSPEAEKQLEEAEGTSEPKAAGATAGEAVQSTEPKVEAQSQHHEVTEMRAESEQQQQEQQQLLQEDEDGKAGSKAKAESKESRDVSTGETGEGAADSIGATASNDASLVTPLGTVQALSRRLSSNSLQGQSQSVTPAKPLSGEKSLLSAASAPAAAPSSGGKTSKSPSAPRSGESSPVPSAHDTKNTINVSQLLRQGAFKMQPLKDFVPYAELQRLRLEDGIDATRKEDYLNDADFQQVFGMDRETFKKQPAWRQAQAKKKANLF